MKTEKTSSSASKMLRLIGKVVKWILLLFFILLLIVVIALFFINRHLESNKTKIFENLAFLNNGTVSFQKASIQVYKDFPDATIRLENVLLHDSLYRKHQLPVLQLAEINVAASLHKILKKQVHINSIRLKEGVINVHTDENNFNNLKSLLPSKPTASSSGEKNQPNQESNLDKKDNKKFKINTDDLDVHLENVGIRFTNAQKNLSIRGKADQLFSRLQINGNDIQAKINMDLAIKELAFNTEQGAFVADSQLKGEVDLEFVNGILKFDPFDLQINEEHFLFHGEYNSHKTSLSKLVLENQSTRMKHIMPLLPNNIRTQIVPYQISKPFYSKTSILSHFKSGEAPVVNVEFRMKNNDLTIFNYPLNEATFDGRFVNRIDESNHSLESDGVKVLVKKLKGRHEKFNLRTQDIKITSNQKDGPQLQVNAQVNGPASEISTWLKNDQFFFENGQFELKAKVKGPLTNFDQLIIETDATLAFEDLSVFFEPADVSLSFSEVALSKKAGDAAFTILSSTYKQSNDFRLDGGLQNLPALLFDLLEQRASSQVAFVADRLEWTDFVDLFGKNGYLKKKKPKNDQQKKKSMKSTISGIHHSFQPRLSVAIDTLEYYDWLQLHHFKTGVYFEDAHTLVLDSTQFFYEEGSVDFNGKLDISHPFETPFEFALETKHLNLQKLLPQFNFFNLELLKNLSSHPEDLNLKIRHRGKLHDQTGYIPNTSSGEIIFESKKNKIFKGKISYQSDYTAGGKKAFKDSVMKTRLELEGDPELFNDFFKTEKFFFTKGIFKVMIDYEGNISNFQQLLQEGTTTLSIENSNVLFKDIGITFPLTKIDLDLKNNLANFNFFLRSDSLQQEINFVGNMENFSELVLGNTGKSLKTKVDIQSPKLIWDQFVYLFSANKDTVSTQVAKKNTGGLKASIQSIFGTFDPTIHLETDTFIYTDDLVFNHIQTGLYLVDSTQLVIDNTSLKFYDGYMNINGQFDISQSKGTPFNANFNTVDLDIVRLLEGVNYLNLPSLQSIQKLTGTMTMDLDLAGVVANDGKGLITEKTKGTMDFDLSNVSIQGMPNLDTIATKIRMKKRFANLRFAPIINHIVIDGNDITIPLMEIQSNALNLFLEGTLSYDDRTNIWVSVPWDNLKKADRTIIPEKRGYGATWRKSYVEITSDERGANVFKIRLFKKKFYKQRDILDQYRKDKRKYRRYRKSLRKLKRKLRRIKRKNK